MGRWVIRIGLGVLALIIISFSGIALYLRGSLPNFTGTLSLKGLTAPVEIVRDHGGIPHIFAEKDPDAYFALGYAHAQDRLWQMEMNRRIPAGRLSEALGPKTLDTDKFLRTLGIRRVAEATLPNLNEETQNVLEAYAAGVNAFILNRSGPLPIEFLLTGIEPEPWVPADSIAWVKMMAWDLSTNWAGEIQRARLSRVLSPQQLSEFYPPYPGNAPITLASLSTIYQQMEPVLKQLAQNAPQPLPEGAGSNNWVASGAHTATGKPLLANDPHLGLTTPSLWYFAHLHGDKTQAIGATLPGVPMIALGRNANIAWGFTNTGPDTQDLYIEKIAAGDSSSYITPEGPRPFETREERIKVKGEGDVVITVRSTRHGPVISDHFSRAASIAPADHVLAFAWVALRDDDRTMQASVKMPRAQNWSEFIAAVQHFDSPQQNIVYADIDGNIGFIAPARIPIRRKDNDIHGWAPSPGWDARYDWQGFIPFEALPRSFNPASGYIATANNKITPNNYPYFLTYEWAEPYRIRRIEQLLQAREIHSVQSFIDLQADTRSTMVDDFLPLLLAPAPTNKRAAHAIEMIKAWNGDMKGERPEPLIVKAWLRELARQIYADEISEDLFNTIWAQRPIFLYNVLTDKDGQGRWCNDVNTPEVETCADRVSRALDLALVDLEQRYGKSITNWSWGDAHEARSLHRPFSQVDFLRPFFEQRIATPGDTYSVNVGRHDIADGSAPYVNRHAASLRVIYDFSDLDRSIWIHSTGQSGNVLSSLYGNFKNRWAKVDYIPMSMRRSDIDAGRLGTLILQPDN